LTLSAVRPPLARPGALRRFLLLLTLLPGLAGANCELSLRWDHDPPFSMELEDGSVGGIYIDLNRAVFARLGCQARLVRLPWARALLELEQGRLDVLPGAFRKPEREAYAHFSGVILEPSRNILFLRSDAAQRWPLDNLLQLRDTPLRLGAQIGVSYGADYQTLMADEAFASRVVLNATRLNLWQMVARRRIDGLIADEHSGRFELQSLGLSEHIRPTAVVVSSDAAEVAFSRKSVQPEFVQNYAAVLRGLVEDGSYRRIVGRYLQ
jgi:polar amino acid transport system substrate-binding protein